jgi:hypothetical protein
MLDAKKRGKYIDDEEEKRKARVEQKKKKPSFTKSRDDDGDIKGGKGFDPELYKINDEGRRVGWAYRYRIRRKLNDLKRQQISKFLILLHNFIKLLLVLNH